MEGKDFVLICNPTWELKIGSNIRNIAIELSKKNRVLYVNPPLDRKTALFEKNDEDIKKKVQILKGKSPDLIELDHQLWLLEPKMMAESINWIPNTPIFKLLNRANSKKYAKCIASAIDRLNFKDVIILNDSLMFRGYDLKELLQPRLYTYYIRDYLVSQPYFKRHGVQMEAELIEKSDLVFANSVFLKNHAAQYNSKSFYVGQGYESSFFDYNRDWDRPEDLTEINTPIIGYVGTLTSLRLDEKMMVFAAKQLKDYTFVMVGPEDEVFQSSELHQLKNVVFLGLKPMDKLAAYVKYFDVCINPQLVNDLTIGNYPLKIDEYLSMGKPTVATKTEAMEAFEEHTYLAGSHEEFATMLVQAHTENSSDKEQSRVAFAKDHTWENCIGKIYEEVKKALDQ